jgi:choice-of-anchor A domain-containing protein
VVFSLRHTFSGVSGVILWVATVAVGGVAGAPAQAEPHASFAAPDACPLSWPVLHAGSPGESFDANVSVLAGGSLSVLGDAAGAEGLVVALGDATFARESPGRYEVGVTSVGSQVPPYANSDMLVVGGDLTGDPGTHIDVGSGLGGDVVVGGDLAPGTDLDARGGDIDTQVPDATSPYDRLPATIAATSASYAALPPTGQVEVTETAVTMSGDGVSDPQVFTVDGATLGGAARSLQLLGVPDAAAVVVNLTGAAVDLDLDLLLSPEGAVVDPFADAYFPALATHLLWNVPTAARVDVGGSAQLPGSLLVATAPSTTTLSGAGTNGRVLVAGDLVHTGVGSQLHSYPFLPGDGLGCEPPTARLGALTVSTELDDPDGVVPADRIFEGRYECRLDGDNVTPADNAWRARANASEVVLSDQLPVGAVCTLTQEVETGSPGGGGDWAVPVVRPERLVVAKRAVRGFTVSNAVLPPAPREPTEPTEPPASPTPTPEADAAVTATPEVEPVPTPAPTSAPGSEPPSVAEVPVPSTAPGPSPSASAPTPAAAPAGEAPAAEAGPVTTTAPFTLRGAFVWAPLLLLSVLTLLLRVRGRPRRPARLH